MQNQELTRSPSEASVQWGWEKQWNGILTYWAGKQVWNRKKSNVGVCSHVRKGSNSLRVTGFKTSTCPGEVVI